MRFYIAITMYILGSKSCTWAINRFPICIAEMTRQFILQVVDQCSVQSKNFNLCRNIDGHVPWHFEKIWNLENAKLNNSNTTKNEN